MPGPPFLFDAFSERPFVPCEVEGRSAPTYLDFARHQRGMRCETGLRRRPKPTPASTQNLYETVAWKLRGRSGSAIVPPNNSVKLARK